MAAQPPTVTAPTPPPAKVQSRFLGDLTFQDGYATAETLERLYDQLDFQRATQVFLRNLPALAMHGFRLGITRDLGIDAANKLAVFRATSASLLLTPNSETLYGITFLSLDTDGPTVIEAPPHVLGLINDMWMRPVEDIGPGGPDHGQGGKYLIVPPGFDGSLPETGYFIVRPRTFGNWLLLRTFLDPSGEEAPAHALMEQTRIYPLSQAAAPSQTQFVAATGKPFDTTPPNDLRAFEWLADLVGREHDDAIDPETAGYLKTIGVEKGVAFAPDARMQAILGEAAQVGSFMAQAVSFAPRSAIRVKDGSQWCAGLEGYPTFNDGHRTLIDPMIYMAWFGTGAAKAMGTPKPGTGSTYAWTYHDAAGEWLLGEKSYRLHLPPNQPAKDFWSVVAYDNWTRAILPNDQITASKNSYDKAIQANLDGSIDLFFGPAPPDGKEDNWIQTTPDVGWFILLRLYGPLQPWFDRAWTPDDLVEL